MREIKFRAWDKLENIMCPIDVLSLKGGGCFLVGNSPSPTTITKDTIQFGPIEGHFVKFQDLELMQYTGLKDKNGKEIYEGDILRQKIEQDSFTNEHDPLITHSVFTFEWKNGAYYDEDWLLGDLEAEDIEIIGNIYENPELLQIPNEVINIKSERN